MILFLLSNLASAFAFISFIHSLSFLPLHGYSALFYLLLISFPTEDRVRDRDDNHREGRSVVGRHDASQGITRYTAAPGAAVSRDGKTGRYYVYIYSFKLADSEERENTHLLHRFFYEYCAIVIVLLLVSDNSADSAARVVPAITVL